MNVKVVQKWEMRPKADEPFKQVTWDYNSAEAGIEPISLLYTISNKGPSIAVAPKVYVLLPVHQLVEHCPHPNELQQNSGGGGQRGTNGVLGESNCLRRRFRGWGQNHCLPPRGKE